MQKGVLTPAPNNSDVPTNTEEVKTAGISPWWLLVVAIISLVAGAAIVFLLLPHLKRTSDKFGERFYEDF